MNFNNLRIFCLILPLVLVVSEDVKKKSKQSSEELQNPSSTSDNVDLKNNFQYPTGFSAYFTGIENDKNAYSPVLNEKQTFQRVQPQLFLYPGNLAPGQQVLLRPATPPNNFLIPRPHPGTDVILRDIPHFFPASGIPRPGTNAPPVEKDAEEIPTDQIGAHQPSYPKPNKGRKPTKPEKLETFDTETEKVTITEAEAEGGKPSSENLKPGQRFFYLNGQTLYPNLEGYNNQFLDPFKVFGNPSQQIPEKQTNLGNGQQNSFSFNKNPILQNVQRNPITGQIANVNSENLGGFFYPDNSILLNQPAGQAIQAPFLFLPSYAANGNDQIKIAEPQVLPLNKYELNTQPDRFNLIRSNVEPLFPNGYYNFDTFQPQKQSLEREAVDKDEVNGGNQNQNDENQSKNSRAVNRSSQIPSEAEDQGNSEEINKNNHDLQKQVPKSRTYFFPKDSKP